MLMFDTTEVRSTCDNGCYYHEKLYGRVFLHSNNCVRRWTNEGQMGTVKNEKHRVSPKWEDDSCLGSPLRPVVTLSDFRSCRQCGSPINAIHKNYCKPCAYLG